MNKKIIIFDMDGVIFDSVELAHELTRYQIPGISDNEIRELYRGNIHEELAKNTRPRREETPEEKEEQKRTYSQKKSSVPMYSGAKDLLIDLSSNFTLALNTSAYESNTLPLLEQNDIQQYFSLIATVEVSKSKVEKFKLIAEKFDTILADTIFITDTIGDIKEAEIAKVPTIAVTWGVHSRAEFQEEQHPNLIGIVDTVSELEQLIHEHR